jgi:hypothetical protein
MKNIILEKFGQDEECKMTFKDLKSLVGIKKNHRKAELLETLKKLEAEQQIYKNENGFYVNFPSNFFVTEIMPYENGNAYFLIDDKCYHLAGTFLNGALYFDKVIVSMDNGPKVVKILNRPQNVIICEVQEYDGHKILTPLNFNQYVRPRISFLTMKKLNVGDRIAVGVTPFKNDYYYDADYIETVGNINERGIDYRCLNYLLENLKNSELDDNIKRKYQRVLLGKIQEVGIVENYNAHIGEICEATLVHSGGRKLFIELEDGKRGTIKFEDCLNDEIEQMDTTGIIFSMNSFEEYMPGQKLLVRLKRASLTDQEISYELIKNLTLEEKQQKKLDRVK